MFKDDRDFYLWCLNLKLSKEAISTIKSIRTSNPSRSVQSKAGNVSGRYPSKKMGRTIQFESHHNELAAILEM
jgi:hypothetical protein